MLAILLLSTGASSARSATAPPRLPELSTPALVERAVERGELERSTADRYLVAALEGEPVPAAYSSDTPFRGTLVLLDLHRRLAEMTPGPQRSSLRALLHPTPLGTDQCDLSNVPLTNTTETAHFYIEYNGLAFGGGLTIDDYVTALETTWSKEVDQFGWAAPPPYKPNPPPSNKFPVRVDPTLGPALYGYVSDVGTHAGPVGNNPATSWNEEDAEASCMVLNSDYGQFPGSPLAALQATAAHEFSHTIQFGWGVLGGWNVPDQIFIEGGATWIEDEVFDDSNDNYHYLWPRFDNDMGQYGDTQLDSPYPYWITWRGITEPYGTGVAGGGENILQRFWELTSKNQADSLEALGQALQAVGTSLPVAYHAYAIAVRIAKPCGGGYQPPHCLEEGQAYIAAVGAPPMHGSVPASGSFQGSLPDNYSLNWISLPQQSEAYQVVLKNTSAGGRFRTSVVCDTGTGLVIAPFTGAAGPGESSYLRSYDPSGCPAPIAVVTNVAQTGANPPSSQMRGYTLSVTSGAAPSRLSVRGRASGSGVVASGRLAPGGRRARVEVTLLEKDGRWREVATRKATARRGGRFRKAFPAPDARRCRLEAKFAGDVSRLPSSAARTFPC
jgi:hypothetical protein